MTYCRVLLFLGALLVLPSLATAATIDGRVLAGEYSSGLVFDFEFTGDGISGTISGGKIYLFQNSPGEDLDVAVVFPRSLNDNTYEDEQHSSWGSKNHDWKKLANSDEAQFVIKDENGNKILDFVMDYYAGGNGSPSTPLSDFNTGNAGMIDSAESGMTFNENEYYGTFDGFGAGKSSPELEASPSYTPSSAALSDWVMDITYEFRINGSALSDFDITKAVDSIMVPTSHHSNNKLGKGEVTVTKLIPTGPPSGGIVPLPASAWMGLGLLGLLGAARMRRRRRN